MAELKVWIDQDLCTGDGICEEICPAIFAGHSDGLFYVKEPEWVSLYDKGDGSQEEPIYQMGTGLASVPENLIEATIDAAEECPGECIMIEVIE